MPQTIAVTGLSRLPASGGEASGQRTARSPPRLEAHRWPQITSWLDRGGSEGDLMELNGWPSPQMLHASVHGLGNRFQESREVADLCAASATRTDNARRRSASDQAELRALSASLDLFGSQFGSQKQKRGRMSHIAANAGPHPATSGLHEPTPPAAWYFTQE